MCQHVREVQSPSHVCGGCGGSLRRNECFHASVLFPDGWQVVRHRAKRCHNKTCTWRKKRVFYNFVAMSKTRHDFFWHPESGSFRGEANVHRADAAARGMGKDVPNKSYQKLFRAWCYWRSCLGLYVFLAKFERAAIDENTFPSSRGKNFKLLSVLVGGSKVR